eukprot:3222821-Pleurochrysis_carterae.AAC.1
MGDADVGSGADVWNHLGVDVGGGTRPGVRPHGQRLPGLRARLRRWGTDIEVATPGDGGSGGGAPRGGGTVGYLGPEA